MNRVITVFAPLILVIAALLSSCLGGRTVDSPYAGREYQLQQSMFVNRWFDTGKLAVTPIGMMSGFPRSVEEYYKNPAYWRGTPRGETAFRADILYVLPTGTTIRIDEVKLSRCDGCDCYDVYGHAIDGPHSSDRLDFSWLFEGYLVSDAGHRPNPALIRQVSQQ